MRSAVQCERILDLLSYLVVVIRIHGSGSRLDCDPVDLGVYSGDDGVGEMDVCERERAANRTGKRRMDMCHTVHSSRSISDRTDDESIG